MENQISVAWQHMIERLGSWVDITVTNIPNFVMAIIVFTIVYWLSQNIQNWLQVPLKRLFKQASIRSLASTVISTLIIAFGLMLSLSILNLDTVLKSLLAGAGVAGLAIGLALQGTLANSFSGVFLAVRDVLNIGDFIETNGYKGTVVEITLRDTKIKEPDNNIVVIPNKDVIDNPFKNYGLTEQVRVTINCGVSYESDLEEVKKIAIEAIKERFSEEDGKNIEFHYLAFGGSSIDFQMRFWVNATAKLTLLEARSEAIMIIKKAFDKHNINIPFPIRTLQMDTSEASLQLKTAAQKQLENTNFN